MEKKLEDYQHLYKGIELIDGKLPLRPLSDMTEDEMTKIEKFYGKYAGKGLEERLNTDAEITRYLLSKHFDLFNLIPERLALDKTKITP
jgi:hypothetical protein